ncbi:MAG: hypothetical protein WBF93_14555 [Pirellulales bacterium]|nr:hypothetical protein [Pirellulales bacterium]
MLDDQQAGFSREQKIVRRGAMVGTGNKQSVPLRTRSHPIRQSAEVGRRKLLEPCLDLPMPF